MWLNYATMFHAGKTTKITGLSYRQLDNAVRNRRLRPSAGAARGRGTVRSFSQRDLVALRLTQQILAAGHRLGPFLHIIKYVQHGKRLPALEKLKGTVLISNGAKVQLLDGTKVNLSATLGARGVIYAVDLGAAAEHVCRGIERLATTSRQHPRRGNKS
ncbi:hypothetical protein KEG38_20630 [Polyangium jinanense]|uniref:hypothetical protein n=1 Tax=Polyangium jinanense TaxID=2829994 RepID=UPI0023425B8F|nr:hypothetical protein [Polyangium jinanense]MDC3956279.1 hypothetical protein [Polyangium jinanense]